MTLTAGARLGPYEVLSPLGSGGMGEVYRARDERLGREVAVKVLPPESSADPDRLRRFEQEARAAGALNHPNLLTVFDTGIHDGAPYIVFELLEGVTLRLRLCSGPLALRKSIDYAVQIASGLAAAHEKGIVHRDLKPENLFVTRDGRVKILDFGLAKLRPALDPREVRAGGATASEITAGGVVLGTAGYMSPEQARGQTADARSDIFAVGSVLYEMISGKRAFQGATAVDTMTAILKEEPTPLVTLRPDVPATLERIVGRCLEKRPEERFQSARDVAFALEAFSGGPMLGPGTTPASRSRSRFARLSAGAAVVVAIALATGSFVLHWTAKPEPPSFKRITFRRGVVQRAKFAPGGQTVVYGAAWDAHFSQIYTAVPESAESRPLGLPESDILSIAPSGEMAVWLGRAYQGRPAGTLARVPLTGGAPREVSDGVVDAAWSPDGKTLAIVHRVEGKDRIEMPPGKVLYESPGLIPVMAVSPKGNRIAFIEVRPDRGSIEALDLTGVKTMLWRFRGFAGPGLVWSRSGEEVWFTEHGSAGAAGHWGPGPAEISAVTLGGRRRVLARLTGPVTLNDMSGDGRVLVTVGDWHNNLLVRAPGEMGERDLSWLDQTSEAVLSRDGRTVLFNDREGIYLRGTDGSPPVRVGEGVLLPFSPDGKSMLSLTGSNPVQLSVVPLSAGEPRRVPTGGFQVDFADWLPDGKRILLAAFESGHRPRIYVQGLEGEGRRALTPEGFELGFNAVSPDGRLAVGGDVDGRLWLVPIEGGELRPVPGAEARETSVGWSKDGRSLFVARLTELPARIHRIDLSTGRRELRKEIMPPDPAGFGQFFSISYSGDGSPYAYSYGHYLCTLYVVEGLR